MKKWNYLAVILGFALVTLIKAQDPEEIIDNIYPPSPEASALGKYGEYPVSLYTGIPNISIPIWNIKSNGMLVPISISYHASGIKIEEISTNVGLGWALNSGGIITRSVRGKNDDAPAGYYNSTSTELTITDGQNVDNIAYGRVDGEADMFYYNFCGKSGSFFFNLDQEIILKNKDDIIIEEYYNQSFNQFVITASDGVKYFFGNDCLSCSGENYREESLITGDGHMTNELYYSSWMLRKIEDPHGESIEFYYDAIGNSDLLQSTQESIALNASTFVVSSSNISRSYSKVNNQKRLDSITFQGGSIVFNHNTTREDVNIGKSLDLIEIKNSNHELIKSYRLVHSYFDYDYDYDQTDAKRLKLDSIIEIGSENQIKKPYAFEYFEIENSPMPPRSSLSQAPEFYAQDHWGFFNGQSNTTLIPAFSNGIHTHPGANREPNWPYTKSNMLEKISYPTGGYTIFEFEPNFIGYDGADTVQGYYEESSIGESVDHCDNIACQTYRVDTFEINSPEKGFIDISLSVSEVDCDDDATTPALVLTIINPNDATQVYSWTCSTTSPSLTNSYDETLQVSAGTYYVDVQYCRYAKFEWSIEYDKFIDEPKIYDRDFDIQGGVRIKTIKNYDQDQTLESQKEYRYLTNLNSGQSSGQPFIWPSYFVMRHKASSNPVNPLNFIQKVLSNGPLLNHLYYTSYFDTDGEVPHIVGSVGSAYEITLNSSPSYKLGSTQGGLIGYNTVFELTQGGGICNIFTSIDDFPELPYYYYRSWPESGTFTDVLEDVSDNTLFPYPPFGNKDQFRGKPLGKIYFNDNYEIVYQEEYQYAAETYDSYTSVKASPVIIYDAGNCVGCDALSQFAKYSNTSANNPLVKKIETHFVDGDPSTESVTEYSYPESDHYQVSEEKTYSSSGENLRKLFYYPYDTEYVDDLANSDGLREANMIDHPIRIEQYHNATLTTETVLDHNSDLLVEYVKDFDPDADGFRTIKTYSKYDDANIQEFTDADGIQYGVIWGYNKQYPVVIAQNTSYSVLAAAISVTLQPTDYTTLEDLLQAVLDDPSDITDWHDFNEVLRNNSTLSDATITSFLHKPLVGKTCETGPGLISTYYEYDGLGRLIKVLDNDKNILQEYEYNYAQ